MLYLDLNATALARLDAFEGPQYQRTQVTVTDSSGRRFSADTYLFRAEYAGLLLPGDWDPAAFEREGRQRFERAFLSSGQ